MSNSLHRGVVALTLLIPGVVGAQAATGDSAKPAPRPAPAPPRPWYDRISLRGYAQIRYNRLFETNRNLVCAQCDRSIGNNGGFFIRRARLIFSGDVSNRVSIYIQPDYASDAAGTQHYLQLRDAYFDVFMDQHKTHRLRLGQSKVPFGFENLQSSSNRLPLDRNDALNSSIPNERDIGVFYAWSPTKAKQRFRILTDSGLKGSGDYGVISFGVMNGETANRPEANNSLHSVARVSYPFRFSNGQFLELGVQAYAGKFVLLSRSAGVTAQPEYRDRRMAVSATWYAQPFGLQGEWNWGEGPEYVLASKRVDTRHLHGGFVQSMYRWRTHGQVVQPFVRAQFYTGGKKAEQDARHYDVHEFEGGVEWLANSALELTAEYTRGSRVTADGLAAAFNRQKGGFLRLQAQINY